MRLITPAAIILAASAAGCGQARSPGGAAGQGDQVACYACHGSVDNAAPPRAVDGATATSDRAVGAHQAHVRDGAFRGAIACEECHPARPTVDTPGHLDGTVQVVFGPVATAGGVTPAWDRVSLSCASTYCHGAPLAGATLTTPIWTTVDGSQATCGSCHGLPPATVRGKGAHPLVTGGVTACAQCHPQTVKADGTIDVAAGKHVNGTVETNAPHPAGWAVPEQHGYAANRDLASCRTCHGVNLDGGTANVSCDACHTGGTAAWRTTCTFCHGDATRAAAVPVNLFAPPVGTQGETLTSQPAVGAHQRHLQGSANSAPVACSECHAVGAITDIAHVTGTTQFSWGPLATAGGNAPAYTGGSCSATYCHGGVSGGANPAPAWTGDAMTCTSCHGDPPPTGQHWHAVAGVATCTDCHGTGYTSTAARAADHPNGVKNVGGTGSLIQSWNGFTCTSACHGGQVW